MYRVVESDRSVLQLDETNPSGVNEYGIKFGIPSRVPVSRQEPQELIGASTKSTNVPPTECDPPDIVLHSDGCAVALHLSVLQLRCPWFYKQLRQLRHLPERKDGAIALKVLEHEELRMIKAKAANYSKCPLRNYQALRLDYVRCVAHEYLDNAARQDSPIVDQLRKRPRSDPDTVTDENQPPIEQTIACKSRRARSLFSEVDVLNPVTLSRLEREREQQRGVMHVKIEGTNIGAVVTAVEYIYRFKVRMINDCNAIQAVKLGQWLGMRHSMLYFSLIVAIRHVTTSTWMELMLDASTLPRKVMRQILCDDLLEFVKALKPEHYQKVLADMRCVYISRLAHHDILIRAMVGLINNIRLVEFWRNLLDALSKWLNNRFQTPYPPSLRAMHRYFAPEWKPYLEREPVELEVKPGEGNLFTLLEFGKFQLQVRIDITDNMPILWRIIQSSSPQLLTTDPDDYIGFDTDPHFWIRGQMKVKYWRAQPDHAEVFQEVIIEYQHCRKQYSQWGDLVPPSPVAPVASTAAFQPEGTGKVQFRGRFFVWGDPVCSIYHFLLQTTLFYSAPHEASTELSDLMVVSEMQRLPIETLVLVLRSDRLRIPGGERTLLRCLNKLVFGKSFNYLGSSANQVPQKYNGRAKDVIRLYKCVRWCFIPLDDIIGTLRRSPRELQFYELIDLGLQDTFRRFQRRRPWGWRKYRHAYMKNETNVVEFRIEAGENALSPEYYPSISRSQPSTQGSLLLTPDPICPLSA
ncbi:uncharacterized protein PHALS_11941 [Plasmopara halstedii]|uniref:Uncharacterized protein n=1 Tax=Plasmopara halstedii TaxID=4781 RepID=A0A0P1AL28_PLAHL|nr:uncharacterized protein PHALS_11941 [Plasmopara halstedii]CEG41607.1 hypothetical protein PHALS_11941 [Plasmopara halstedii]|eukprot:XP_024577976.1 hypothetical protein PHALS_11941 [Plasmopara halstedii]